MHMSGDSFAAGLRPGTSTPRALGPPSEAACSLSAAPPHDVRHGEQGEPATPATPTQQLDGGQCSMRPPSSSNAASPMFLGMPHHRKDPMSGSMSARVAASPEQPRGNLVDTVVHRLADVVRALESRQVHMDRKLADLDGQVLGLTDQHSEQAVRLRQLGTLMLGDPGSDEPGAGSQGLNARVAAIERSQPTVAEALQRALQTGLGAQAEQQHLRSRLAELSARLRLLDGEGAEGPAETAAQRLEALEARFAGLEGQFAATGSGFEHLEREVALGRTAATCVEALERQLAALASDVEDLRALPGATPTGHADAATRVEALERRLAALASDVEGMRACPRAAGEGQGKSTQRIDSLEHELASLRGDLENKLGQRSALVLDGCGSSTSRGSSAEAQRLEGLELELASFRSDVEQRLSQRSLHLGDDTDGASSIAAAEPREHSGQPVVEQPLPKELPMSMMRTGSMSRTGSVQDTSRGSIVELKIRHVQLRLDEFGRHLRRITGEQERLLSLTGRCSTAEASTPCSKATAASEASPAPSPTRATEVAEAAERRLGEVERGLKRLSRAVAAVAGDPERPSEPSATVEEVKKHAVELRRLSAAVQDLNRSAVRNSDLDELSGCWAEKWAAHAQQLAELKGCVADLASPEETWQLVAEHGRRLQELRVTTEEQPVAVRRLEREVADLWAELEGGRLHTGGLLGAPSLPPDSPVKSCSPTPQVPPESPVKGETPTAAALRPAAPAVELAPATDASTTLAALRLAALAEPPELITRGVATPPSATKSVAAGRPAFELLGPSGLWAASPRTPRRPPAARGVARAPTLGGALARSEPSLDLAKPFRAKVLERSSSAEAPDFAAKAEAGAGAELAALAELLPGKRKDGDRRGTSPSCEASQVAKPRPPTIYTR